MNLWNVMSKKRAAYTSSQGTDKGGASYAGSLWVNIGSAAVYTSSSRMSTVMQQTAATPSSLTPSHAAMMPAAKATAPASGD